MDLLLRKEQVEARKELENLRREVDALRREVTSLRAWLRRMPRFLTQADRARITGEWVFDRDPDAPFGVSAGSAKVDNLDADLLDGKHESEFADLSENETITGEWIHEKPLHVEAPADADALIVGSPTKEGGDLKIYGPGGYPTVKVDADASTLTLSERDKPWVAGSYIWFGTGATGAYFDFYEPNQVGYISGYAIDSMSYIDCIAPHDLMRAIRLFAPKSETEFVTLDLLDLFLGTRILVRPRKDDIMLDLGYDKEGGDIRVRRTATADQFYLDADAEENVDALTLYGRLKVGVTKPIRLDGSVGRIYADRIDEITSGGGIRLQPFIGVGATPDPTIVASFYKLFALTSGWARGLYVNVMNNQANPQGVIGLLFASRATHATGTMGYVYGVMGQAWAQTNATVTNLRAMTTFCTVPSGFTPTITNVVGGYFGTFPLRTAVVTNFYGCFIDKAFLEAGGSIARAYGLYCKEQTAGATNWSALFEGDIQINSDKKLILEGTGTTKGDTYIVFNSAKNRIEFYLNGVLEGWIDTTGFVSA